MATSSPFSLKASDRANMNGIRLFFRVFLRWTLIFFAFLYLIGLVMALFEIFDFQRLVNHTVNNDWIVKRAVLAELHSQHEEGNTQASQDKKSGIPLGALAVQLDRLNQTSRTLTGFNNVILDESNKSTPVFKETISQIRQATGQLKSALKSNMPNLEIPEQLDKLENLDQQLSGFRFNTNNSSESTNTKSAPKSLSENTSTNVSTTSVIISSDAKKTDKSVHPLVAINDTTAKISELTKQLIENVKQGGEDTVEIEELDDLFNRVRDTSNTMSRFRAEDLTFENDALTSNLENANSEGSQFNSVQLFGDAQQSLSEAIINIKTKISEQSSEASLANEISQQISIIEEAKSQLERLTISAEANPTSGQEQSDDKPNSPGEQLSAFESARTNIQAATVALVEALSNRTPEVAVAHAIGSDKIDIYRAGKLIWGEYLALSRFSSFLLPFDGLLAQSVATNPESVRIAPLDSPWGLIQWPLSKIDGIGLDPHNLATLGGQSLTLILVFVIGAIGSLIYITKYELTVALQGNYQSDRSMRPFSWYILRPIFGVIVAFAAYLLYRAGQIALGSGGLSVTDGVNVPILSVIALFSGLLSWHALDMIESKGSKFLKAQSRKLLWATGLRNALKRDRRSIAECANHIGRSPEQVERWIGLLDPVTPEFQDRITTWLDVSLESLFSDLVESSRTRPHALYATGLENALKDSRVRLDASALAEILNENPDRIRKWVDLSVKVSPAMQWQLVDILNYRHSELFEEGVTAEKWWATGLRTSMKMAHNLDSASIAKRIGVSQQTMWSWMDLHSPVPVAYHAGLANILGMNDKAIVNQSRPELEKFLWVVKLKEIMDNNNITRETLSQRLDIDPRTIDAWIVQDPTEDLGRVPPSLQAILANVLGVDTKTLFSTWRTRPAAESMVS